MVNLLKTMLATKLSWNWYGNYRKLEDSHRNKMSATFEASPDSIRAAKQLFNSKISSIHAINSLKTEIREYWEKLTTPFPDPGIRLLLKTDAAEFNARIDNYKHTLWQHANDVQKQRDEILADAAQRLGKLFNPGNYPADLASLFNLELSFPSLQPPSDLPEHIYATQKQIAQAKLKEAVTMAEAAFVEEFGKLVANLADKLTPDADGKKKVFHNTALTNLTEFFDRFQKLNITNNDGLDQLVTEAKSLIVGLKPEELRTLPALRDTIAKDMTNISTKLTPLITKQPRRKLLLATKDATCQQSPNHTVIAPPPVSTTPAALFATTP